MQFILHSIVIYEHELVLSTVFNQQKIPARCPKDGEMAWSCYLFESFCSSNFGSNPEHHTDSMVFKTLLFNQHINLFHYKDI